MVRACNLLLMILVCFMQVVLVGMVTYTQVVTVLELLHWVLLFLTMELLAASAIRSYVITRRTQSGVGKECLWPSPQQTFAHQITHKLMMPEVGATRHSNISIWLSLLGRKLAFMLVESSPLYIKGHPSFPFIYHTCLKYEVPLSLTKCLWHIQHFHK